MSKPTLQGAIDGVAVRLRDGQPGPQTLGRRLKARPGADPGVVRAHQRQRLLAAMVQAVAEDGYAGVTTRQLRGLAGVSERTIYEHFSSKDAYFLATYDGTVASALQRISAAYRSAPEGEDDWTAGLCRAFAAFGAELSERPTSSRFALVDVLGTGSLALERIESSEALFMQMIAESIEPLILPEDLLRGIVGGVWCVARLRVLQGVPGAISECRRELLDWLLSYCSPGATALAELPAGGVHEDLDASMTMPQDARQRALHAAAGVAGSRGYASLSVAAVADVAELSPDEFFALYASAEECLLGSSELFSAQALACALRASERAPDWPTAVCRAVRALLRHIAANPLFARASFVESFATGTAGIERHARLVHAFAEVLARRAPRASRPDPLVAEAIVGAIWSIARHRVVQGRATELPAASACAAYLVLAPLIGAGPALEAIRDEFGEGDGKRTPDHRQTGPTAARSGA